jgi:hypothetical protein
VVARGAQGASWNTAAAISGGDGGDVVSTLESGRWEADESSLRAAPVQPILLLELTLLLR